MDIEKIIESIEEKIDGCPTIPFWGRGIIDKDELLDMLQEMKNKLPEELSQAKWVNNERQRIINDAQKRAETMIKETEEKIAAMVTSTILLSRLMLRLTRLLTALSRTLEKSDLVQTSTLMTFSALWKKNLSKQLKLSALTETAIDNMINLRCGSNFPHLIF